MATALLSLDTDLQDSRLQRSLWYNGALLTVHADSTDTKGGFALLEFSGKPGGEPPLHVHEHEDELFYVIEGRLQVTRGAQQFMVEEGESALLPRRVPHTFRIVSPSARMLVYLTPGGFERYFRSMGRPAERLTPEPNPSVPDIERMIATATQFGISFIK